MLGKEVCVIVISAIMTRCRDADVWGDADVTFTMRHNMRYSVIFREIGERSYLRRAGVLCSQFPVYTISLSCSPGVTSDMMSCLLSASSPLHQPIRGQVCRLLANQRPRMGCHSRCLFMLQPSLLNIQPLGSEKNVKCYFLSYEYNTRLGSIRS